MSLPAIEAARQSDQHHEAAVQIPDAGLPPPVDEEFAREEADELGLSDRKRTEVLRDALNVVAVWGLRIVAASCFIGVVVRVWHLIGPTEWLWIDPLRLQQIDHILLGVLGGFGARYFSSVMVVKK